MSRRHITYAALVVASFVLAACSQPLAPSAEDTINCRGVIVIGNGVKCPEE